MKTDSHLNEKVVFVIANFNGEKLLEDCLSSIFKQTYKNFEVVLVDNGSKDNSLDLVKKIFPQVLLIPRKKNLGFSKANNIGIEFSLKNLSAEYIALVNTDARLDHLWLEKILAEFRTNKTLGAVCGKVLQLPNTTLIDSVGHKTDHRYRIFKRGYGEEDTGQYENKEEVISAIAVAVVYKKEMLESIKIKDEYFDEDFFAYHEDADLSLRAKLLGWKCFYVPSAISYHFGQVTSDKIGQELRIFLSLRNRIWLFIKILPLNLLLTALFNNLIPQKTTLIKRNPTIKKISYWEMIYLYFKALFCAAFRLQLMLQKRWEIRKQRKLSNREIQQLFNSHIRLQN